MNNGNKLFKCLFGAERERDVYTVKFYEQTNIIKLTYMPFCKSRGIESPQRKYSEKGSVNTAKLDNNLSRAKSKVLDMALSNPWDYWCTFTIDKDKYDRYNLKAYYEDFSEFIHNYNRRTETPFKVRYLLIPERHQDGAWHMHGFIKGIRLNDLYINEHGHLAWRSYEKRFGFISMDKIRSQERTSFYSLKYMTKDASRNVSELGAHLYYCSKGLKRAKMLYKGSDVCFKGEWAYEGDYCKIKNYNLSTDSDIKR